MEKGAGNDPYELFLSGSITEDFRRTMVEINPIGFIDKPLTRRSLSTALASIE